MRCGVVREVIIYGCTVYRGYLVVVGGREMVGGGVVGETEIGME